MNKRNIPWLVISIIMILASTLVSACTQSGATLSVVSTSPANAAQNVGIGNAITATFNAAVDPSTVNTSTFVVKNGASLVGGTVSSNGKTAIFTPNNAARCITYTATITTGVSDSAGNRLARDYVWSFSTVCSEAYRPGVTNQIVSADSGPSSGNKNFFNDGRRNIQNQDTGIPVVPPVTSSTNGTAVPAPVYLGPCPPPIAILAGSTITNTGTSQVTGDIDLSPGTSITGYASIVHTGTVHQTDAVAATAQVNLTTAYNDAAGRTPVKAIVAGNLDGQTLTKGIYKSTSSLGLGSGGILTLDAQGDPNAVFIFQIASTLITGPGSQIVLINSAQAKNVFWQVGTSATLGTNSIFNGIIMADQSITLTTGARLNGRALARIGAVTLDTNIVTAVCP